MQSSAPVDFETGIALREYAIMLRKRALILAAIAVTAAIAAYVGTQEPPTYQATAQAVVSGPPTELLPFKVYFENARVAESVVNELGLNKPPLNLTAARFIAEHLTVDAAPGSNTLTATVRLVDGQLAARAATMTTERAVELWRELIDAEFAKNRAALQARSAEAERQLATVEARILQFQRTGQTELLEEDVTLVPEQRRRLADLTIRIGALRAQIVSMEGDLKGRERFRPAAVPPNGAALSPNSTYDFLDQQLITARAQLAAIDNEASQVRDLLQSKASALANLARRRADLAKLISARDDLSKRVLTLKSASDQLEATAPRQLRFLSRAPVPDAPTPQPIARNVTAAALIALAICVLGSVAVHSVTAVPTPGDESIRQLHV